MAQDAIAGSTYLKAGGVVWTQDPNTCTISTMVDAVTQTGAVTFSGSPQELAEKMIADYGAG
jgi:Chemotaxis response regulator containing a CheY-like receiver domain and a methylesterase domain